jgi:hypothetical protein
MISSPAITIATAPLLVTAILLLATSRTWRARRMFVEHVMLAALTFLAAAALSPLPPVVFNATLPLAAVVSAWLAFAHAAWRFAPDFGQRGVAWVFHTAAAPALPAALGAAIAIVPAGWLNRHSLLPLGTAAVFLAAMITASALHRALTPPPRPSSPPPPPDDRGGRPLLKPSLVLT